MELLETNDPKSELLRRSAKQRASLEEEMTLLSERTEKILTNSLIIGGALLMSYFLVRQFSPSKVKTRPAPKKRMQASQTPASEPQEEEREQSVVTSVLAEIGTKVASHVTALLLSLAKEKLLEYLESQAEKKKETE